MKRLRDVQMSSLSENDSDNEPQDSLNDSDNNSFGSEIRKDLSRITFENHGSPDSNSELLRFGLISQQSQSQSQPTPQSPTQSPRSPQKDDQRKFNYTKILSHKVFSFTKKDKADVSYKNGKYSVELAWTDGTSTWEPLREIKTHSDKIADYIVENDLFELTKQSKMWGSKSAMNEINKRREDCDKQASSNKRKRKASLTQCDTSDKTPSRCRSKRRR